MEQISSLTWYQPYAGGDMAPLAKAELSKLHLLPSIPPSKEPDFAKHLLEALITIQWGVIRAGQEPGAWYVLEAAQVDGGAVPSSLGYKWLV